MIADQMLIMQMFLRYTHDTIRPLSFYGGEKSRSWFGSCMVHKGDLKILSQMLKNIDEQYGKLSLKHRLLWRLQHNIVDELKKRLGSFTKVFWFRI
jgi:aconitate hydratase 2/2-methylisocitrate dehydratase